MVDAVLKATVVDQVLENKENPEQRESVIKFGTLEGQLNSIAGVKWSKNKLGENDDGLRKGLLRLQSLV